MHKVDIRKEFKIVIAIEKVIKCHEECEMYLSHMRLAIERYREAIQPGIYTTPDVTEESNKLKEVKITDFFPTVGMLGIRIRQLDEHTVAYKTWQGIEKVIEEVFKIVITSDILFWELHELENVS